MKLVTTTHLFHIDQSFYRIDKWELATVPAEATHLLVRNHDGELGRQIVGYVRPYEGGELGIHLFFKCATEGFAAVPLTTEALEQFKAQILRSEGDGDDFDGKTGRPSWQAHLTSFLHTIVGKRP